MARPDFSGFTDSVKCFGCGGNPCINPGTCGITSRSLVEDMKKYQLEYMIALKKAAMSRTMMPTTSFRAVMMDFSNPQFLSFGGIVFQAHKDYLIATLKLMNL